MKALVPKSIRSQRAFSVGGSIMTSWIEILEQIKTAAKSVFLQINSPATSLEVKALEEAVGIKLPEAFREYLYTLNGQINTEQSQRNRNTEMPLFGCHIFLSVKGIVETWSMLNELFSEMVTPIDWVDEDKIKPLTWNKGWIPFTEFEGSTYLILDCDPGKNGTYGQIFIWHAGMDYEEIVADSFKTFSTDLLFRLKAGQFAINEFGVISFEDHYI